MAKRTLERIVAQLSDAQATSQLRPGASREPIVVCRVIPQCEGESPLLCCAYAGRHGDGLCQVEANSAREVGVIQSGERRGGRLASL